MLGAQVAGLICEVLADVDKVAMHFWLLVGEGGREGGRRETM